jgi:cell wall-associated NlpC family hydrolase
VRRPLLFLALVVTVVVGFPATGRSAAVWHPAPEPTHPSEGRTLAHEVVKFARRQIGVPYRYGGSSRSTGFDCSGLVYAAYLSIGKTIPRSSWEQLHAGRPVRFADLRAGDLLFTEGGGHVQLVVSSRVAISAPETGERVRYVAMAELRGRFAGARRLLN